MGYDKEYQALLELNRDTSDKGRRYHFVTAEKLITDFWKAVDHYLKENEVNL